MRFACSRRAESLFIVCYAVDRFFKNARFSMLEIMLDVDGGWIFDCDLVSCVPFPLLLPTYAYDPAVAFGFGFA